MESAVSELKRRTAGRIMVHGSGTLVQSLLAAKLVDELRLMVFPVLVGGGTRLYPEAFEKSAFRLTQTHAVMPNVITLTYALAN